MSPLGDHGAVTPEFSEFFRAEYPRLVRGLAATGATVEEAKDVAQEAMLELAGIWPNCRRPYGWVRKVAWHKYLKIADRDRKRTNGEWQASLHPQAVQDCDAPDEREWVRQQLMRLPPRQRAVMALYVDGYSTEEIAELLKMEVSTVRSHLRHARIALRRGLEGDQPEDGP
ncbi:RNA polymerase sigma factor [Streptomyces spectabilis]|uniref:RNA polymerase sigma factor n=1 Tax=Streptomyces spectabilis TaxID=68270 RepID=UPI00137904F6|nr:RNA polymerase sigma factor [Streptomyces spectabilis]